MRIINRASKDTLHAPNNALNRPDHTAMRGMDSAAKPFISQPHTAFWVVGSAKGSRQASSAKVGGPGNALQLIVAR